MCFQLSYTLFQCLASWVANNLYIFLSQIHLHWRFDILNTIPNTSSNILLLYHTCLEVQTFIHREDHVKTPKLKVHFRSRRSAQIKLKKKQNLILKFRSPFWEEQCPRHLPQTTSRGNSQNNSFYSGTIEREYKSNECQNWSNITSPFMETYSEPQNELGIPKMTW